MTWRLAIDRLRTDKRRAARETTVEPAPGVTAEARVLQRVEADRASQWPVRYEWLAVAASLVIAAGVFYAMNRPSAVGVPLPVPAPQIVEHTLPAATPPSEAPAHPQVIESPRVE